MKTDVVTFFERQVLSLTFSRKVPRIDRSMIWVQDVGDTYGGKFSLVTSFPYISLGILDWEWD